MDLRQERLKDLSEKAQAIADGIIHCSILNVVRANDAFPPHSIFQKEEWNTWKPAPRQERTLKRLTSSSP